MKARILKALLNNTGYAVHQTSYSTGRWEPDRKVIAIGSPMCSTLLTMDMETFELRYALDTFNKGRTCLADKNHAELAFIWDKLENLARSGEIKAIIEGRDMLAKPLPVFSCEGGKIIESQTDKYGWPNVTVDGFLMYENVWFKTRAQALKNGLENAEAGIKSWQANVSRRQKELDEAQKYLAQAQQELEMLEKIQAGE